MSHVLRWVLTPLYDWTDLRGPDGRPSLTKLAYVGTLIVGLAIWVKLAMAAGDSVDMGFLGYSGLILTYALGRSAFTSLETAILAKWGGTEVLKARASGAQPKPSETP